jgi:predicted glycosyltransferase
MLSPPQNCLKIVALISGFIGKCKVSAMLIKDFPKLTRKGLAINLKSKYDLNNSESVFDENAILVLSNEIILK